MNKKAAEGMTISILIMFIIGTIVGLIIIKQLLGTDKTSNSVIDPIKIKSMDTSCKLSAETRAELGKPKLPDLDDDSRPDNCDICISLRNSKEGSNEQDEDDDGMPHYCDKDDSDRTITTCKFNWNNGRCVEGSPTSSK